MALFSKVRTMTTSKGMLFATVELLKDSLDHTLTCSSQLIQRVGRINNLLYLNHSNPTISSKGKLEPRQA